MRIIKKYQATFAGTTPASSFHFQFQRIYKQQPHHKFIVRCTNITDFRASSVAVNPHNYFMVGGFGDGLCTYSGTTDEGIQTNDFFIGTTATNGAEAVTPTNVGCSMNYQAQDLHLNDIPLNPFKIAYRHTASNTFATGTVEILIAFEIIEYEPDKQDY